MVRAHWHWQVGFASCQGVKAIFGAVYIGSPQPGKSSLGDAFSHCL